MLHFYIQKHLLLKLWGQIFAQKIKVLQVFLLKTNLLKTDFIVHRMGTKLVSNLEQNMLYNKIQLILCRKKISMLIALKVSSLASKCAFYRPERRENNAMRGYQIWKVLKCKNEIHQRIELKQQMRKWGHLSSSHVHYQFYDH